ncbi:hypothetical protein B0T21DRAFT_426304 [Apiosordaria backusii]|uniref:Uncharacterized protein n=1 Tax=Apiosordaria backusii TaxID=314023 RepID=A0AA40DSU6_9PEZI|nr:hypothetical protein B0T21DRAFT_426304 [Apiosordaria backusii]
MDGRHAMLSLREFNRTPFCIGSCHLIRKWGEGLPVRGKSGGALEPWHRPTPCRWEWPVHIRQLERSWSMQVTGCYAHRALPPAWQKFCRSREFASVTPSHNPSKSTPRKWKNPSNYRQQHTTAAASRRICPQGTLSNGDQIHVEVLYLRGHGSRQRTLKLSPELLPSSLTHLHLTKSHPHPAQLNLLNKTPFLSGRIHQIKHNPRTTPHSHFLGCAQVDTDTAGNTLPVTSQASLC